ncbi:MAG: DMT family transporter [Hyphomicrobium sp.]
MSRSELDPVQPGAVGASVTDNVPAIMAMIASAGCFVGNDTCIKMIGGALPLGEVIFVRGVSATVFVLTLAAVVGGLAMPARPQAGLLAGRMTAEIVSTFFFLSGLIALPIADATAISQFTPLAMTVAAAVILKEAVGWRRWLATFAGLIGVLLIVRPGSSAFSPAALFVLASVALVVARDLFTRRISADVTTLTLTLMSAAGVAATGLLLLPFEEWLWPSPRQALLLAAAGLLLTGGYAFVVVAMRTGDVGTVAPFRYSVILFALLSGFAVFGELPDGIQTIGIAIVTAAGLYTFSRERQRAKLPA